MNPKQRIAALTCLFLALSCSAPPRPAPGEAQLTDISEEEWLELELENDTGVQFGETLTELFAVQKLAGEEPHIDILALSGGGQHGAFGAGILLTWPKDGRGGDREAERPVFDLVTGISTGALQATAAFLHDDELDEALHRMYTSVRDEDIFEKRGIFALFHKSGLSSYVGLAKLLEEQYPDEVIDRVGAEYEEGRRLYVGTVNMDTSRFQAWDLSYVAWKARGGKPDFYRLYRKVLLASASIPMVVEPQYIRGYMHSDGGTRFNIFLPDLIPPMVGAMSARGATVELFVIMNGRLDVDVRTVQPTSLKIGARAVGILTNQNSYNGLIRIRDEFLKTAWGLPGIERSSVDVHLAYIPSIFAERPAKGAQFDPVYMTKLARLGRDFGRNALWLTEVPEEERATLTPDEVQRATEEVEAAEEAANAEAKAAEKEAAADEVD